MPKNKFVLLKELAAGFVSLCMNLLGHYGRARFGTVLGGAFFLMAVLTAFAQTPVEIRVVEVQQTVEISPAGANYLPVLTRTNQVLHASEPHPYWAQQPSPRCKSV